MALRSKPRDSPCNVAIGSRLGEPAHPLVVSPEIEAGYRAMAADREHEAEAAEWLEGMAEDLADEEV